MVEKLVNFFTREVMPRPMDTLLQAGAVIAIVALLWQYFYPGEVGGSCQSRLGCGVWFTSFAALWFAQSYVFQKILLDRGERAQPRCEDLPEGLYPKLTRAAVPHAMDAMFQGAGLFILAGWYLGGEFKFLASYPTYVAEYAWVVGILALWFLQQRYLRLVLRDRVRKTYFEQMYWISAKA